MKGKLAEIGMVAPNYAKAWQWLYSQPIERKPEETPKG